MKDGIYGFFFALPFIMAFLQKHTYKSHATKNQFLTLILLYVLVISVGVQGLYTATQQIFFGEGECLLSGRCYSPYLMEVGMMNFSFGLGGLCCYWLRGSFWFAIGAGYAIFLLLSVLSFSYEVLIIKQQSLTHLRPKAFFDLATSLALIYLIFRRKS